MTCFLIKWSLVAVLCGAGFVAGHRAADVWIAARLDCPAVPYPVTVTIIERIGV